MELEPHSGQMHYNCFYMIQLLNMTWVVKQSALLSINNEMFKIETNII